MSVEGDFYTGTTNLNAWIAYGDGRPLGLNTDIAGKQALVVSRDTTIGYWADLPTTFGTYGAITAANATYSFLSGGTNRGWYTGGVQTAVSFMPTFVVGGTVTAAVRLASSRGLKAPVYIQIIDNDGAVLSEAQANIGKNEQKQWFASMSLDQLAANRGLSATNGDTVQLGIRIMQKVPTGDTWTIEAASMFWDPIVWQFSSDSGVTWWDATSVRGNPNGVILFPWGLTNYTSLKWRVITYGSGVHISHLAIRPWYVSQHGDAPPAPPTIAQGPNTNGRDGYGPIEEDPRWQGWDLPVPRWWWNE
jgi:hypothetical protein